MPFWIKFYKTIFKRSIWKFFEKAFVPSLLFWENRSLSPASSPYLPFWVDLGLNVDQTFYKLDTITLPTFKEIRCVRCCRLPSWAIDPSQLKDQLFCHKWKKRQEQVWESISWFLDHESLVELNRILLKYLLLSHVDIQEGSRKYNAKLTFKG